MLSINNLHKSFEDLEVLKGISLNVEKGQTVAIIGPSGSGKSTLLRCINLLEIPQSGTLKIANVSYDAKHLNKKKFLEVRRASAMVFQHFNLFANKNVLENVTAALTIVKKIKKEEAITQADALLKKVGLFEKRDAFPSQLSGGQQQRVAIARALAIHPHVLLFDEPTSSLDPELVHEVLKVIQDIAKEHMTSIIVTHEMQFARDVADYVIFMDDGKIVEEGIPSDIFQHPKQERTRQFLGQFLTSNT